MLLTRRKGRISMKYALGDSRKGGGQIFAWSNPEKLVQDNLFHYSVIEKIAGTLSCPILRLYWTSNMAFL